MKLILKKVHSHFYRYSIAFFFYLFWPFLYYFSRRPERYGTMNAFRKICALLSSIVSGIIYRVRFEQPVDWSRTYIVCPNHTSNVDISAMSLLMKNNFCFIGKDALMDKPVTGLFFRSIDIPVNRESKMSSFRAFKMAEERLRSGQSVIIFPEGMIPDDYPPQLHQFKNGPFRLAIDLKIPIIPVTSPDTWKVLWDTGLERGSRPGICHIFVHKPVETAHLRIEDVDNLRDEVFTIISQKFESA